MAEFSPVSGEADTPTFPNLTDCDALYSQEIIQTLNSLRCEGLLCDVTLMVDGKEFKAHRNILAASSSYFRNMFTIEMKEKTEAKVVVKALSSSYMEKLLTYLYTGTVEFENESCARELMLAADYLVVPRLNQVAGDFLLRNLTTSNCLGVHQAAVMTSNEKLKCGTLNFINKNFMVVAKTEVFLNLDVGEVIELISSDEVEISSEEDMFEVIVSWVEHSKEKRKDCMLSLLDHVRLTLLSLNYLHARVLKYELIWENRGCLDFVLNRMEVMASQLDTSLCERPRKCLNTHRSCLMIFITQQIRKDSDVFSYKYSQHLFVPEEDKAYILQNEVLQKNLPKVISCQGFVYNIDGSSKKVERYDPSVNSWTKVAPIPKAFIFTGVASLNGVLYVCGGEPSDGSASEPSSDVFTYNPKTNSWQERAQMIHPRKALCAVAAGQHIYAIGGNNTHAVTNTVQQFDPKHGKWNIVSSMKEKRCGPCGVSINNKIFVFGGSENSSAEMYDVTLDQWQKIQSMTSPRYLASAAVIQDVVYIVGGLFNLSPVREIVECYNPSTEQWMGKCSFPYEKPYQSTTSLYCTCCPVSVPKTFFTLPEVKAQST